MTVLTFRIILEHVEVAVRVRNEKEELSLEREEFGGYDFHMGSAFSKDCHFVWFVLEIYQSASLL